MRLASAVLLFLAIADPARADHKPLAKADFVDANTKLSKVKTYSKAVAVLLERLGEPDTRNGDELIWTACDAGTSYRYHIDKYKGTDAVHHKGWESTRDPGCKR